jgi:hypothetical protein
MSKISVTALRLESGIKNRAYKLYQIKLSQNNRSKKNKKRKNKERSQMEIGQIKLPLQLRQQPLFLPPTFPPFRQYFPYFFP